MYIYIYIHVCICMYIYMFIHVYIYIYREREKIGELSNISTLWPGMIIHTYILATRVLTRFTFRNSVYIPVPDCRSHGCSGDNQFDSEAAGRLKPPSSGIGADFCKDAEGEWHNVYGVVDDIS